MQTYKSDWCCHFFCFMFHQYVRVLTPNLNLPLILLTCFAFCTRIAVYNVPSAVFVWFPVCGMQYYSNVIDQPCSLSIIQYNTYRANFELLLLLLLKILGTLLKPSGELFCQFDRYALHSDPSILSYVSHCMWNYLECQSCSWYYGFPSDRYVCVCVTVTHSVCTFWFICLVGLPVFFSVLQQSQRMLKCWTRANPTK
jgi:hypothetical protein